MDLMRDSTSHGLMDILAPRSVQTRLCLATVTGTDHQTGSLIRNRAGPPYGRASSRTIIPSTSTAAPEGRQAPPPWAQTTTRELNKSPPVTSNT